MTRKNSKSSASLSRLVRRGEARYYPKSSNGKLRTVRLKPGVKLSGPAR